MLENVLQRLKDLVCSNYVLTNFEFGFETNLFCDSSDYAVGAVLTQIKEGDMRGLLPSLVVNYLKCNVNGLLLRRKLMLLYGL